MTVRTLHHYDEIGLLTPSARSPAGYRLYTEADLTRLQHIVVYRRLGFALEEIALLLDAPGERRAAPAPAARRGAAPAGRAARARRGHRPSTGEGGVRHETDQGGAAGSCSATGYSDEYAAEAEQRWGDTDAVAAVPASAPAATRSRTGSRSRPRWRRSTAAFVAAKRAGLAGRLGAGDGCGRAAPPAHQRPVLRPVARVPPATSGTCTWPTRGSPGPTTTRSRAGPVRAGRDPRQRGPARRVAGGSPRGWPARQGRARISGMTPHGRVVVVAALRHRGARAAARSSGRRQPAPAGADGVAGHAGRSAPLRRARPRGTARPRRPPPRRPATAAGSAIAGRQHPDVRRRAGAQRQRRAPARLPRRAAGRRGEHRGRRRAVPVDGASVLVAAGATARWGRTGSPSWSVDAPAAEFDVVPTG